MVRDHVGRAYGLLSQAHLLTSKDALRLLSGLRLGVELGILNNVSRDLVDELLILSQPAHLQKKHGSILDPAERDAARADLVRERLAGKEE
jgi:protein arginine kinase